MTVSKAILISVFLELISASVGFGVCPTPLAPNAAFPKGASVYYNLTVHY